MLNYINVNKYMHLTNEPPNQARNKSITKANKLSIMCKFKSGHKHTKKKELCQNPDNLIPI